MGIKPLILDREHGLLRVDRDRRQRHAPTLLPVPARHQRGQQRRVEFNRGRAPLPSTSMRRMLGVRCVKEIRTTRPSKEASRGLIAIVVSAIENSPGDLRFRPLGVPQVVQPADKLLLADRLALPQRERPCVHTGQRAFAFTVQPCIDEARETHVVGDDRPDRDNTQDDPCGERVPHPGRFGLSGPVSGERVSNRHHPVGAMVERQLLTQAVDEDAAVLVDEVHEADLPLLGLPARKCLRLCVHELAAQGLVLAFGRLDDLPLLVSSGRPACGRAPIAWRLRASDPVLLPPPQDFPGVQRWRARHLRGTRQRRKEFVPSEAGSRPLHPGP